LQPRPNSPDYIPPGETRAPTSVFNRVAELDGRKTTRDYWDTAWRTPIRLKLPSRLNVDVLNLTRLLSRHVRRRDRYIEIGCAPGKLLAWVAAELKADAVGLEYSAMGANSSLALFDSLGLSIELHQDDFFDHHLQPASFDVVASFGLIEHFEDPRPVVQRHLDLVKPGGILLITVPNFGGVYGRLQKWCDPENLSIHNLAIMNPAAMERLLDLAQVERAHAFAYGNISLWCVNLGKRLPGFIAKGLSLLINSIGLLQFGGISSFAPLLVLEARKRSDV
jgi:2-polyprenyl-3-methyl-5-hydroxy-6-metoxy-1,4-benzoquinol methylase